MKCPTCNGTGIDDDRLICYKCGGTGKVKQTNEEWFCSLSTEEKAKEFVTIQYQERDICNLITDEMIQSCLQRWVEWLKQPHTPNMI